MKKFYFNLMILPFVLLCSQATFAQFTEAFENETIGSTTFSESGYNFSATGNPLFDVEFFNDAGAGDSDQYLDNFDNPATNQTNIITLTSGPTAQFTIRSMELYASSSNVGNLPTDDGMVRFVGKMGGATVFDYTKMGGYPTSIGAANGFFTVDFTALPGFGDVSSLNLDSIEIILQGAFQYIAVDNFVFDSQSAEADPPEVQTIAVVGTPNSTATTVDFLVTFNENANLVTTDDFSLDAIGTTGVISALSGGPVQYTVTVNNISGEGTISIDLNAGTDIQDDLGNSPPPGFTAGEDHFVSRCFQETFESFTVGDIMFSSNGVTYTTGTVNFNVANFVNGGAGGSDQFIDNDADQGAGKIYTISTPGPEVFTVEALDFYLSSQANGANPTDDGTLTLRGKVGGSTIYTIQKTTGFPTNFSVNNGYYKVDFSSEGGTDNSLTNVEELEIEIGGAFIYVAADNFEHCEEISNANPPIVQSIKLIGNPAASDALVDYEVIFNENALNVTADDFSVTTTGTAVATVAGSSGSGNTYTVNLTGVSGEGTIRLDLNAGTDIADAEANTPPDPFTDGEIHIVTACDVETFEALALGTTDWTTDITPFSTGTLNFAVDEFIGGGAGGSDRYLDNINDQGTGKIYNISVTDASVFFAGSIDVYVSSELNGANPTDDGSLTVRGFLDGGLVFTVMKATGFPTTFSTNSGYYTFDFATEGGLDNSMTDIDQLQVEIGGAFQYISVDNFKFCEDLSGPTAVCMDATIQLDSNGMTTLTAADIDGGSFDGDGPVTLSISPNNQLSQPNSDTNFSNINHGQSFSAFADGSISKIRFYVNGNSSNRTIHFYNSGTGSGTAGSAGTPDYTETGVELVDAVGGTVWTEVTLTTPFPVIAGNQYSFIIDGITDIYYTSGDVYPGGAFIFNYDLSSGCCSGNDIAFEVDFIPTLDCSSVGAPVAVELLVTDTDGNTDTCTAMVTVEDNIAPTALCQPATIQIDASGVAVLTPNLIDGGSSDNCEAFTGLRTTSFDVETTTASPSDNYGFGTYYIDTSTFIVETTTNYTFSASNYSGDGGGHVIVVFDNTPIRNSGNLESRPEFVGYIVFDGAGTAVQTLGTTANLVPSFSLEAGNTYFMDNISLGTIPSVMSATIGIDTPIISTDGEISFTTCSPINPVDLIAFDASGNMSSCTTNVEVLGQLTEYTIGGGWSNGLPTPNSFARVIDNYSTASGNIDACSCEVTGTAELTVAPGSFLRTQNDINVLAGGVLTVQHEGSVVQINDAAQTVNGGVVSVLKDLSGMANRDFHIGASPMTMDDMTAYGAPIQFRNHITGNFIPNDDVALADPLAENFADNNGDNWVMYAGAMNPGEGYLIMPQTVPTIGAPADYTFNFTKGTLNNGVVDFDVQFFTDQNSSPNILGNPYASAIDADLFMGLNTTIDALYFWEHLTSVHQPIPYPGYNVNNYDMGDISIYSAVMGGIPAANGGNMPNEYIASGQGFGIKAASAVTAEFNNSMRVVDNNDTFRRENGTRDRLWLNVFNDTYELGSTALIGFSEITTDGFDQGADIKRLATPVSLYSELASGEQLAINAREAFEVSAEIPMSFRTQVEEIQTYRISIREIDGVNIASETVYLFDHQTGEITNLNEQDYTFSSNAGTYPNRFTVLFENRTLGVDEQTLDTVSVYPNPAQNILYIVSPNSEITKVEIHDIRGRMIQEVTANTNQLDLSKLDTAIYMVTIYTEAGKVTKRVIKE